jgi:parallel beta-helix repeat protein
MTKYLYDQKPVLIAIFLLAVGYTIQNMTQGENHRTNLAAELPAPRIAISKTPGNKYYVDISKGNDANNGRSEKLPFKTINKANEQIIAGDTIYVKNGVYLENITIKQSGTANSQILFQAFPGHKPFIKGTQDGTFKIEGNYIKIMGFEITSTVDGSGIHVGSGNHHTQIFKNEIHDSGCGGVSGQETDYLHIEGNVIYRNSFRSPFLCSGISIYQAVPFDNKPGFHNIIRGNTSYANENKRVKEDGTVTDGNGIIIDDFRHTQGQKKLPKYTAATLVENNIVFDNGGRGIHIFQSDNVVVRNNTTFKNLKSSNLHGTTNGELSAFFSSNIWFYNNIAYAANSSKKTLVNDYSSNNIWDYNLSYNGTIFFGLGKSSGTLGKHNLIGVSPLFINPSIAANKANFRLQANSPAIKAGTSDNAASIDFTGKTRPVGVKHDMGAYQMNGYK